MFKISPFFWQKFSFSSRTRKQISRFLFSLLETRDVDSIFLFLFSIWLFGISSMPDYVLWYKRRTHTQTQTLPLLLFSMMFHPATTFLELRGETWNSHHFSIQTTGYRENNQSVDWIWKSLQKYFQTKLNMGFHWNKNDMLIFTGGTGATHGPDHGQIG